MLHWVVPVTRHNPPTWPRSRTLSRAVGSSVDIPGHVGLKLQAAETKTRKDGIPASYLPDPMNNWMISIQIVATHAFVSASFVVMK